MDDPDTLLTQLHDQMMSEEYKAEMALELEGVERGIANIRRVMTVSHGRDGSVRQNNLLDTEPGRLIFHDLMRTLVPAFEEARQEALDGITAGGRGVKPTWWWLIAAVPPEKTAFLAIRSVLTIRMASRSLGRKANAICLDIVNCMKMQTEYEAWARVSQEKSKDTGVPDLAKLLMKTAKKMNSRQWSKWRKKIDDIETLNWTRAEKFHIGAKLLDPLIVHGGGS